MLFFLQIKLNRLPSNHAVVAFELLVKHMLNQYKKKYTSEVACEIRARVSSQILSEYKDPLAKTKW